MTTQWSTVIVQPVHARASVVLLILALVFCAACGSDGKVGIRLPRGPTATPFPTLTPVPEGGAAAYRPTATATPQKAAGAGGSRLPWA
jgi:hypothetical protein